MRSVTSSTNWVWKTARSLEDERKQKELICIVKMAVSDVTDVER